MKNPILRMLLLLTLLLGFAQPARAQFAAQSLSWTSTGVTFATLTAARPVGPPQIDGTLVKCKDCLPLPLCTGGGTGALAFRINGAWTCLSAGGGATGG